MIENDIEELDLVIHFKPSKFVHPKSNLYSVANDLVLFRVGLDPRQGSFKLIVTKVTSRFEEL